MSKNLTFLSLTDNSLLIQEQSFIGPQVDSLTNTGISFFDAKITHNQLYRYFFHETAKADEVFDRIAKYHRKYFDEIKADEVLFKRIETGLDTEEVKLDATDFNYEWLRIRKFNEAVGVRDLLDPVKVLDFKDSFKIGEERVQKVLPTINATDEAVWFDPRVVIELTKGALPLQLAGGKDDLVFVGNSSFLRDIVKPEERLFRKYLRLLSEPDGSETTAFFESDYFDSNGNVSGLVNFELTKTITKDIASLIDNPLAVVSSEILRDKIKVNSDEVLKVGKNILATSKVFLASDFTDPRTNAYTGLVKRFIGKFQDTDVTKFTQTLVTLGNFELLRDALKTDSDETLTVGKRAVDAVKLAASVAIKGVLTHRLDESKFNEKLLLIGKAEQYRDFIKTLNPISKSAFIIAHIDPVTKDIDKIKIAANRDVNPNNPNFVDLHSKLPKADIIRIFSDPLVESNVPSQKIDDELKLAEDNVRRLHAFNITIPVTFSQEEQQSGSSQVDYNEPATFHPNRPNTNPNLVDPYYTHLWNTVYKFIRDSQGNLEYPSVASTYPDVVIDNSRREDFAFADDGNSFIPGDSDPFYAPAALVRPAPFWDGTRWRYPSSNSLTNIHPVFNASGRRINLGAKRYSEADFEKARKAIYDDEGNFVGYEKLDLDAVFPSGETLWLSLVNAGIYIGRFQLHIRPHTVTLDLARVKQNLLTKSKPTILKDTVGFFFYPYGEQPVGVAPDVNLKRSLGRRIDIAKLAIRPFKRVNMEFGSPISTRPGELLKGKDLVAAIATKSEIYHDRFHAFFNPRGHTNPDVAFGQGKGVSPEVIKLEGQRFKRLEISERTPDRVSGKDAVAIIANAQRQIITSEKIITASSSKNLIKRSIHESSQVLAIIGHGPLNPFAQTTTTAGTITRLGNSLYASYNELQARSSQSTYAYTNLNTYTETPIPPYVLFPYYLTGSEAPTAPYAGNFTYGTGVAYSALGGGTVRDANQPYYSNGSAAFIWDRDNNYWLMTTGLDFSSPSLYRQIAQTIDPLTTRTTSTHPGTGNITVTDPNGGVANFTIRQNVSSGTTTLQSTPFWEYLGEIESIFRGTAPTSGAFFGGNLYQHTDGHLYTYLSPIVRNIGGGYKSTYTFDNPAIPAVGGTGWVRVSNRTGADLTPPNETLSLLAADDAYFSRLVQFRKEYTETIEVADPGSAQIPVYCASYFLEPYVSEAGKSANF